MISLDDKPAADYLAESREHLAGMERDLLTLEKGWVEKVGEAVDEALIDRVFRAAHSVKGGADLFDLEKIRELAHRTEEVLSFIRSGEIAPVPARISVLLRATARLYELIATPGASNQADISEITADLEKMKVDPPLSADGSGVSAAGEEQKGQRLLRMLLVEDDFASRVLLQTFLSRYGECHIAVNGVEAVEAFRVAAERGQRYDLICMDIMMPEMDGREAVHQIRAQEEAQGICPTSGAKIIMTTTVRDVKEVIRCFQELCDAYLMKPIDLATLLDRMKSFELIPRTTGPGTGFTK